MFITYLNTSWKKNKAIGQREIINLVIKFYSSNDNSWRIKIRLDSFNLVASLALAAKQKYVHTFIRNLKNYQTNKKTWNSKTFKNL